MLYVTNRGAQRPHGTLKTKAKAKARPVAKKPVVKPKPGGTTIMKPM